MRYGTEKTLGRIAFYLCVGVISIIMGFPLYWMLVTSLMPSQIVFKSPPNLIPPEITLDNYIELFKRTLFPEYLMNSIVVSLGCVLITTACSVMAGYALKRYPIPQKKNIARTVLLVYMFPEMLFAVPYFLTFKFLGLINTYPGLILAHVAATLPFGVWLMWMFFQTVPDRFEECAWILGAGRIRSMFEVAMRMALPGAVAIAVFSFAISWGDYTFALILTSTLRTVPVGLASFVERAYVHWGLVHAGSTISFLPPFILVILLQKYILKGFSLRGV